MVLPLIMKSEKNEIRKYILLSFVTFEKLREKLAFLEIAAQTFKAGDFLNTFLRFFWLLRLIF